MSRPTYAHRVGAYGVVIVVCQVCGTSVADTTLHDEHHAKTDEAVEMAEILWMKHLEEMT